MEQCSERIVHDTKDRVEMHLSRRRCKANKKLRNDSEKPTSKRSWSNTKSTTRIQPLSQQSSRKDQTNPIKLATKSSMKTPEPVGKTCKCEDCDITLSLTDLTKHIVTIHRGQKMNRCIKCKRAGLMNVNSFMQHNSEYHTKKPKPSQVGLASPNQMTSLDVKKSPTGKSEVAVKELHSTAVKFSKSEPFTEVYTSSRHLHDCGNFG